MDDLTASLPDDPFMTCAHDESYVALWLHTAESERFAELDVAPGLVSVAALTRALAAVPVGWLVRVGVAVLD
ncbi:MAG: hypothetical protein ACRDV1_05080 [Actinomycetes bacterium]